MKETELRIGNYVRAKSPEVEKYEEPVLVNSTYLEMYCRKNKAVHFQPIELSEEWMFKLGFLNTDEGEYFKDWKFDGVKVRYKKQNEKFIIGVWTDSDEDCVIMWLDYVHELQNAFHSIRGKELKLMLKNPEQATEAKPLL